MTTLLDDKRSCVLVALIPNNDWLDKEASAAEAAGLPVYRFPMLQDTEHPVLTLDPEPTYKDALVIHRGFMLTGKLYAFLYRELQEKYGWKMIVSPEQYERAHYYPNAYPFLCDISPRAVWTEVQTDKVITRDNFLPTARIVASWGCQSVVMKDYVKSAKDCIGGGKRFLEAPADDPVALAELAIELIAARGSRFNRGVVFKEFVPLKKYPDAWGCKRVTNEWRCFFGPSGCLLSMDRNSNQRKRATEPPNNIVKEASTAAKALGSPYMTVDLAECAELAGRWIVLEAGDGGVSGAATSQDIAEHWHTLAECFKSISLE